MMKLTRKLEYSLMVLQFFKDHQGQPCTARQISSQLGIPFDSTSKVMQLLGSVDVLTSQQGVKGGYQLTGDLAHLSYYDLVSLIESKEHIVDCLGGKCSMQEQCNITTPAKKLNFMITHHLKTISINDILNTQESTHET